jgi:hypothetical protein
MPLIFLVIFFVVIYLLFRSGIVVLDRKVFNFQVDPILSRGRIRNIREYKVMHNYIEMLFEQDPDGFNENSNTTKLNKMMNEYHDENS